MLKGRALASHIELSNSGPQRKTRQHGSLKPNLSARQKNVVQIATMRSMQGGFEITRLSFRLSLQLITDQDIEKRTSLGRISSPSQVHWSQSLAS